MLGNKMNPKKPWGIQPEAGIAVIRFPHDLGT